VGCRPGSQRLSPALQVLVPARVRRPTAFFGGEASGSAATAHNQELQSHGEPRLSWLSYIGGSEFWEATLQNWQSEFLAVGSFAILAVYPALLRPASSTTSRISVQISGSC
jgi:hypothetical protein